MALASDFMKSEKDKPLTQQTLSNRDLVNRQYFFRYEDCVDGLDFGQNVSKEFLKSLHGLYWSFIVPRKYSDRFPVEYRDIMQLEKIDSEQIRNDAQIAANARRMLEKIGEYMHRIGVNKTEKDQTDLLHAIQEERETVSV